LKKTQIELPPKLVDVFTPGRGELRYRGAHGGRGSAKSYTFAQMAAVFGYAEKLRILCLREFQNSIKESFHAELKNAIQSIPWLEANYDVGVDYIRGHNGTEFIFKGLRNNISSIKSLAQIDVCIIEEAEDIAEDSWLTLEPTIRAEKSEFWVIWNPRDKGSATDKRFIQNKPDRSKIAEMNWSDNPWFPSVLDEQRRQNQKNMDDATYAHVWDGAYLEMSDAQVFKGKYEIKSFEPDHTFGDPLFGLDFGFSKDPTAAVELYIKENNLYIYRAAGKTGLELDDTAAYLKERIPEIDKFTVRADNARPESISYLARKGIPYCISVSKGKGSVKDGVAFMQSFDKIIINEGLPAVVNEFRMYRYKVDKRKDIILPEIIDEDNHYIDACRYALEDKMKGQNTDYRGLV